MEDYKQEIINTRLGCLGSSDAKLLAQVAANGSVPKSAYKRLAVVNGLIPNEEIPQTAAVVAGDIIEQAIFAHLSASDSGYVSNPRWESKKFSRKNVKLISHPDIVKKDEKRSTLYIYEVKTTKDSVAETREKYKEQLYIHSIVGKEICQALGKGWKMKLYLTHYSTEGLDIEKDGIEFDPSRITLVEVRQRPLFNVGLAMDVIDTFLSCFDEYYNEEVGEEYLPVEVRNEFTAITEIMNEIKVREQKIEEFKDKLYRFLCEKNIKSIKSSAFSISRVDDTEIHQFDTKKYLDEFAKEHPLKYAKLAAKYDKTVRRKGYAKITIRKEKDV